MGRREDQKRRPIGFRNKCISWILRDVHPPTTIQTYTFSGMASSRVQVLVHYGHFDQVQLDICIQDRRRHDVFSSLNLNLKNPGGSRICRNAVHNLSGFPPLAQYLWLPQKTARRHPGPHPQRRNWALPCPGRVRSQRPAPPPLERATKCQAKGMVRGQSRSHL